MKKYSTWIALFILIGLLTLLTDGIFLTPRNLTNLTRQVSINGILAIGMTFVIIISGIDLSIGSVVALTGIIVGLSQVQWGYLGIWGTLISTVLALLSGALCGLFNSYWISKHQITSFIITLGMMVIARGLALIFSDGVAISPMSEELQFIGNGYIPPLYSLIILIILFLGTFKMGEKFSFFGSKNQKFSPYIQGYISVKILFNLSLAFGILYIFTMYKGIPIPVLLLALVGLCAHIVLNHMTIGRYLYAMGGNLEASRLSGVPIQKVTVFVFTLMGILSGLCGLLLTARLNGAMPTAGNLFELDAIAAVVIGGTSLMGGVGTITGSLLGAFIIGTLNNGMSLMNVPTFYQMVIKGMIIILAVFIDTRNKEK